MTPYICTRSGHIAVAYESNFLLVWGGYMEPIDSTSYSRYRDTDEIWVFNTLYGTWSRLVTKGDIPPKTSGSCGVLVDEFLYVFGGYISIAESDFGNTECLYRLNLKTSIWEHLIPNGQSPTPCDKLVGWHYNNKLYFFGGFGPLLYPESGKFKYKLDTTTVNASWPGRGWNNQLVCYDIKNNKWEWPTTHGPKAGPRAAHAADMSGSRVYIFGGRIDQIRDNDLHVLNMETMTWSGDLKMTHGNIDWPEGRSWHSLTFISSNSAILYGGLNQYQNVLGDWWKLEVLSDYKVQWQQFNVVDTLPVLWHKATYFPLNKEIYLVGGFKKSVLNHLLSWRVSYISSDHLDTLSIVPFAPKSLLRVCLDYIMSKRILYKYSEYLPATLVNVLNQRCKDLGLGVCVSYCNNVQTNE